MFDSNFVSKIEDLVRQGVNPESRRFSVGHKEMIITPHGDIRRLDDAPTFPSIGLNTLTGMVDYIKANKDNLEIHTMMLRIDSYARVMLIGPAEGPDLDRQKVATAEFDEKNTFRFDRFLTQDEFIIGLRTLFVESEMLDEVVKFVSNLAVQNSVDILDDGTSMSVQMKKGIRGGATEREVVKARVKLRPARTFHEIDPVESEFIVRLKAHEDQIPMIKLVEADAGAWQLKTVEAVQDYLKKELGDLVTILR